MTTSTPHPAAGRFADVVFHGLPLACLLIPAAVAAATGPGWSVALSPLPWIVSLAVVGLPHGAADFAASRRAWRGGPLVALWMAYAVIMAAVAAGFAAAPRPALAIFAVLSCWHFGLADADFERPPPADCWDRALAAASRGAVALAVPLIASPAATATAADDLVRLVMPAAAPTQVRVSPGGVLLLGLGIGGVGAAALVADGVRGLRGGGRVDWPRRLLDLAAIVALGVTTDPLFAVGTYFFVWHAWRQMAPLAVVVGETPPNTWWSLAAAVTVIHAAALPLLVPTWGALAAAWWAWSPSHSARDLALLSIGAYLVVTPAHELLGDLLRHEAATVDRRSESARAW